MKRVLIYLLVSAMLISAAVFPASAMTTVQKFQTLSYARAFIMEYGYDSSPDDDPLERGLTALFDRGPEMYAALLQYMPSGHSYMSEYPGGSTGEERWESLMAVVEEERARGFENPLPLSLAGLFAARPATYELIMTAMLGSYDKYTGFIPAGTYSTVYPGSDSYVGIGVTVTQADGAITVTEVRSGGPAEEAGILPGDIIFSVGGILAEGAPLEEISNRMRGEEGTAVEVVVIRGEEKLAFTILRRMISNPNVSFRFERDVCIIEITGFAEGDAEAFRAALEAANDAFLPVVIDLRSCPGGNMSTMTEMLGMLIPGEEHILTYRTRDGDGHSSEEIYSSGGCIYDGPLAVLVSGSSASAAEMMAVSLSELERAKVIGTTTYGKFRAQYHVTFSDDSAIVVTASAVLSPSGKDYNEKGFTPDIYIENPVVRPELIREISLNFGNCSDDAEALNHALVQLGLLENMPEKYYRFGEETAAALRVFRSYVGLEQTSGLTAECAAAINAVLSSSAGVIRDDQLAAAVELVKAPAFNK